MTTFLGLTQTVHGLLASWSDGRVAVLETREAKTPDGGTLGPRFVPFAHADYASLWPADGRARRATDALALPEVCGCDVLNVCGLHAAGK